MNILLIDQYSQLIQNVIQHTDDILREVLSDNKVIQGIKNEWYSVEDNTDWDALLKDEASSYVFDPSIYLDILFNE